MVALIAFRDTTGVVCKGRGTITHIAIQWSCDRATPIEDELGQGERARPVACRVGEADCASVLLVTICLECDDVVSILDIAICRIDQPTSCCAAN